jgi:dihydroneopterin aldolase
MVFAACHGVHPHEKTVPTRIEVDLEVETDLADAGRTDELDQTIDYSLLYCEVARIVTGGSRNLIETLAEEIAACVLRIDRCCATTVTVRKIQPPIGGICDSAEVEVRRVGKQGIPRAGK